MAQELPPPDRITRPFQRRMDQALRADLGLMLAKAIDAVADMEAAKKAAAKTFAGHLERLTFELGGLKDAVKLRDGETASMQLPCIGTINPSTWQYDVYRIEIVDGREERVFDHTESLPEQYADLTQPELPFRDRPKDPLDDVDFPEDDEAAAPKGGQR